MKRLLLLALLLLMILPAIAAAEGLSSWEEVEQVFAHAYEQNERQVTFVLSQTLLDEMEKDHFELCAAAARAGYEKLSWSWWSDGKVSVTSMEPITCPFRSVRNQEDLISAVSSMRESGESEFVILAGRDLFKSLMAEARMKKKLLLEGGLYTWAQEYYNENNGSLRYTSCKYWNGAVREASSEAGVLSAVEEVGNLGYDSFALLLDAATYDSLTASDSERLASLMAEAFVCSSMSFSEKEHILYYQKEGQSVFYPGYVILRAVRNGSADLLPERLRETLQAAEKMISGIHGTPAETALAIHDLLSGRITYTIDETTDEDDCCIGGILNGKANCDGYSDAFLLLCGLKNIPVRLVHGDALKPSDPSDDAAHMWNLILLNGTWRGVDVTWDDQDENGETIYIYYNMGEDRMKANYSYLPDFLPPGLQKQTDLLDRPVPEFNVATADEVCGALRTLPETEKTKAILWMSDQLYAQYKASDNPIWKWLDLAGISGSVVHSDELHKVEVSGITPLEPGTAAVEAASVEELLELMHSTASGISQLRIYCSETLYAQYKASDNPIWKWLDLAGISGSVVYSDNLRRIEISGITPLDPGIMANEAATVEELLERMHSAASSGISQLRVYCSGTLYAQYKASDNPIWKWLDLAGISGSVVYSDDLRRIVISEIAPLEPGILAAEADTAEELTGVIRNADRNTVNEIRIYCSDALFSVYTGNQGIVWDWTKSGGISDVSVKYNESKRLLIFSGITW